MSAAGRFVKPAAAPDADLACELEVAVRLKDEGVRDRLARAMLGRPKELPTGVEVRFEPRAWDDVLRYIEVESQCCPFLDLSAIRESSAVVLTVTGRPEARGRISQIFAPAPAR